MKFQQLNALNKLDQFQVYQKYNIKKENGKGNFDKKNDGKGKEENLIRKSKNENEKEKERKSSKKKITRSSRKDDNNQFNVNLNKISNYSEIKSSLNTSISFSVLIRGVNFPLNLVAFTI